MREPKSVGPPPIKPISPRNPQDVGCPERGPTIPKPCRIMKREADHPGNPPRVLGRRKFLFRDGGDEGLLKPDQAHEPDKKTEGKKARVKKGVPPPREASDRRDRQVLNILDDLIGDLDQQEHEDAG